MMRSVKELNGFAIQATDGEIGTVDDLYFEDETWKIRYVIVDTGHWLPGRRVLLSPVAIGKPDWEHRKLPVALTRQKVKESPEVSTDLPILRRNEIDLHQHYLWEPYWIPGIGGLVEGMGTPPGYVPSITESESPEAGEKPGQAAQDPHLRSASETQGYDVEATDGAVGHLDDILFDEMGWAIHWLVVDTGVWIAGKKVLIPASWVKGIDLASSTIALDLPKSLIHSSPSYNPDVPVGPQLEEELFAHYRRAA